MRLEQLEYLREIEKHKNMTRAAEAIHVSQPSLSEAIKRLEEELELPLLERYYNGVVLTEAGQQVVQTANTIFQQLELLQSNLNTLRTTQLTKSEEILLEVAPFLGNTYLFQFLQACKQQPQWIIKTEIHDTLEIINRAAHKKTPFGIILIEQETLQKTKQKYPDLQFHFLKKGHLKAVLKKTHPLNTFKKIPLQQLAQYPLLFPKNGCIPAQQILNQYYKIDFVESAVYTMTTQFLKVENGISLTSSVILDYFQNAPFDDAELSTQEIEIFISTDAYLVTTQTAETHPSLTHFIQFAEKYFFNPTS